MASTSRLANPSPTLPFSREEVVHALETMQELFRDYPATELIYHTPFQLLMSVMLSAQTTDKQVNKVTEKFYDRIRSPQNVLELSEDTFYHLIRGVNYSKTKAKHIYQTSLQLIVGCQFSVVGSDNGQLITDKYFIPNSLSELIKLPGVGTKTAKVVLAVLYDQPYIAVDTHVHRVAHRLGRVENLNPEKTSEALENMIPDDYKGLAHRVMIYFGRHICKSQNPGCEECPLQKQCVYYKGSLVEAQSNLSCI